MKHAIAVCVVGLALGGCKAPLVWKDPSVQAVSCGITGAVLPLLESLAVTLGFPLSVVKDLYSTACEEAAAKGLSQHDAEQYGLQRARILGEHMRAAGMRAEVRP